MRPGTRADTEAPAGDAQHEDAVTSARTIAEAWARELPGAPTRSVPVVTAVKVLAANLRRRREAVLRRIGVDTATLDLLSTLRRSGEPYSLTTRELTRRCLVTAGAISQRVARAERDGLVTRRGTDGRRVEIILTRAGHELVETSARLVLQADEDVVAGLEDDALEHLEELLGRWSAAITAPSRSAPQDPGQPRVGRGVIGPVGMDDGPASSHGWSQGDSNP